MLLSTSNGIVRITEGCVPTSRGTQSLCTQYSKSGTNIKGPSTTIASMFKPYIFTCWSIVAPIPGQIMYSPTAQHAVNTFFHPIVLYFLDPISLWPNIHNRSHANLHEIASVFLSEHPYCLVARAVTRCHSLYA